MKVEMQGLTKHFGTTVAVDDFTVTLEDGELTSILGPSGCGKSTVLNLLAGILPVTAGRIYFDGEDVTGLPPEHRGIGLVFQNYALYPHMTVMGNISFPLEIQKVPRNEREERARAMAALVHVDRLLHRKPKELSGGQQQRVAIARTLATGPKVLFMDEPLSNLDAKLRMEMRTELKRLHLETDSTFVYVTHDQLEAMTLSSRICLLKEGYLQQYEPPLEVYHNPANLFVADFVGSPNINLLQGVGNNVNLDEIKLDCGGLRMIFTPRSSSITLDRDQPVAVGIRPEYIRICTDGEKGKVRGTIYSTLPSGMETIVRIDIGGQQFTCVVFGGVDFAVDEVVEVDFDSQQNVLFDLATGKNLALGKLDIIR